MKKYISFFLVLGISYSLISMDAVSDTTASTTCMPWENNLSLEKPNAPKEKPLPPVFNEKAVVLFSTAYSQENMIKFVEYFELAEQEKFLYEKHRKKINALHQERAELQQKMRVLQTEEARQLIREMDQKVCNKIKEKANQYNSWPTQKLSELMLIIRDRITSIYELLAKQLGAIAVLDPRAIGAYYFDTNHDITQYTIDLINWEYVNKII